MEEAMSNIHRGLGRGLDALFGDTLPHTEAETAAAPPPQTLPLGSIVPNPKQPRHHFAKEPLEELAASIREQGLIQPLLVRPKRGTQQYEIVAGERRWRAAGLAGLNEVPVFIRDLSDEEVMAAALIENLQREDLNPIEEALALNALREHCQLTQEQLAARIGKSRPAIANALRLLQLSMAAQDDVQFGRISAGQARALLSLEDADAQEQLRMAIHRRMLNVRDAEAAAAAWKAQRAFPWETEAAEADGAATPDAADMAGATGAEAQEQKDEALAPSTTTMPPKSSRSKSPLIKSVQKEIGSCLKLKVSINGSEERGRITLTYTNADELAQLLAQWGIELPK